MNSPKYRHRLNSEQLDVLELLYKFRFGSSDLMAQYFGKKSGTSIYKRLRILQEQELIAKRYEPNYRLAGKPAAYYLLPSGARALNTTRSMDIDIKTVYKDKTASEQFIAHNLAIFKIYCDLKIQYGDQLKFFTKNQLRSYEYFPDPLPDAYFRIAADDADEPRQYFLEILVPTKPFFVSVRKARRYIAYDESGAWDDTDTSLPTIILACDNETLKKRIGKQLAKFKADTDSDELKFITATNTTDILASI